MQKIFVEKFAALNFLMHFWVLNSKKKMGKIIFSKKWTITGIVPHKMISHKVNTISPLL